MAIVRYKSIVYVYYNMQFMSHHAYNIYKHDHQNDICLLCCLL